MLPDQSLQVREFAPIVERQPINVHYQRYEADSASDSSITWNIDAPFAGALLDNEVLIQYDVTITPNAAFQIGGMWDGANPAAGAGAGQVGAGAGNLAEALGSSLNENRLAFCEGFSVAASMQSCNVTINGQTLTQSPRKWMGEFMRFYASPHEEKTVCSLSGGEFDSGDHSSNVKDDGYAVMDLARHGVQATDTNNYKVADGYATFADAATGGVTDAINLLTDFPTDGEVWYNPGFTKRFYRLSKYARTQDEAAAAGPPIVAHAPDTVQLANSHRFADTLVVTVYERLPMSPFLLWEAKDGRHSIPYVDKMEIDLRFVGAAQKLALSLQGVMNADPTVTFHQGTGPKLHLKWYIPPMGMVMQPQVSIPIQKIKEYSKTFASVIAHANGVHQSTVKDESFNNIRLQQIPDLFMIYAKPVSSASVLRDPLEKHLEIQELRVTVNGDSGKVLQASSGRLFSLYVKNAPMAREREYEYDTWRKKYCTVVLTPADLGVLMPPGVNHGVTLDVELKAVSHYNLPSVRKRAFSNQSNGIQFELHILSIYDKYEMTLTNRGNAQLKLLNVPSPAVAQGVAQPDSADLAQAFA